MSNLIQLKRNTYTATGNPTALAYGELGWNNNNGNGGKLWIGSQRDNNNPATVTEELLNKPIVGTSLEIEVTETASQWQIGIPASPTISGDLTVSGNLTVSGDTITANVATVTVEDKTLELGQVSGTTQTDTLIDGAGIIAKGTANDEKKILYEETGDKWTVNKDWDVTGNIIVSGTVDGRNLQTDGTKLDGIASSANNYTFNVSADGGATAAVASGATLDIIGGSGITGSRSNTAVTLSIDTTSVCTIDATQTLTNKTIDGGTFS
tara:strand:- start:835 stop:1632 length:798 start_codon:yes stop_codon:yes gene_type:complete